ncbi:glyoxalase/bleomycin resistance/extradiol dioxygenase family protein [Herbiconiux sp. CPCC 203407]|uniref:Glyoxalase/bleomycin resistance/extradiol dioxygenase family protein n=1 Tax=Herbiconiux oxytropis TaxID=2970915 RepID=A0AA42BVV5_9MICO|nr:glyoxalase/bleomycin resistance/extradiol dioxygenase family protein [Herbiconiux oxytropis]MCS5723264.1 glyoxalase/bleomycin resistance/extradiol dioxygenase family protein [Herbiconiux oxytropis]MCS5727806.1 glyoxalase/bleomycin resistance/extradiol dioxygenase family protein [Herbiconiux oxytropis]
MTTENEALAADGEHTTHGTPHGSTSLTPHIVVTPAAAALEFYRDAFGATLVDVTRFPASDSPEAPDAPAPDSPDAPDAPPSADLIAHAVLDLGTGMLTLSDPLPAYGLVALDPDAGHPYSLALYVPDVDAVTARAEAAGAMVRERPATFVTGDRFSSLLDPFGIRWSIMTRVEDLSPAESARRVADWASTQS